MKKNKVIGMVAVLTLIVLTACDKTEDASVQSIEGTYVGTLTIEGLKSASGMITNPVNATTEITKISDAEIEVHCYSDELDTTFMLNYYDDHDSVMVCLTGDDFEHMYGHIKGEGHMSGGMMGDITDGETEWQHHMDDEHEDGDEHFGGFDMNTNNFSYTCLLYTSDAADDLLC